MSNSPIDTQEIVRLYIEEQLSVREIANRYGRSYGKIYNLLRNRVIMRPASGRGQHRSTQYLKVAEIMRERIVSGDWPPNRKILSQNDLALIFGVGLPTIRVAITHLRQRGYLTTKPGRNGIYVRPPQAWKAERQG
jgi:transposase